jgi:hypothetical protein
MDANCFKPDTRYTVTMRDARGGARVANLYVFRVFPEFLVVRSTSEDGLLRKIAYADLIRVVDEHPVDPAHRYRVPQALLEERTWRARTVMQHYASGPGLGK